jgi:hypothetical protein
MTFLFKDAELTIDALAMKKDFMRRIDVGRDASFMSAGISYGHLLFKNRVAAQIGYKKFTENAETLRFDNSGWEAFGGFNVSAWTNGSVYTRYTYRKAHHKGLEPVFGIARKETENRTELGAAHTFSDGLMKNWKLSATWQRTEAHSNVSIYTYK